MTDNFYWRNNRDSILTPAALQIFQILNNFDGEDFESNRPKIDQLYSDYTGKTYTKHGGIINTWIRAFQEAGWVTLVDGQDDLKKNIQITPAGKQAIGLLGQLPDFLKAAPSFVIELLARYQLNNPAQPEVSKNSEYDNLRASSDIFPYWTLFKLMRSLDNRISSDELRRFVFRIQKSEELDTTINLIKEYRREKQKGATNEVLDSKFPTMLEGAIGEPKYIMGRLGTQVGKIPAAVEKIDSSTWSLNKYYIPFIDGILDNKPIFQDFLSGKSWMDEYGRSVELNSTDLHLPTLVDNLDDENELLQKVRALIDRGEKLILFSGPPGTGKTWHAQKIATKLVTCDASRLRNVQFHASYGYDDFVEGLVPELSANGFPTFRAKDKVFLELSERAKDNIDMMYVIVIDEFTRGDPSRIFGELLTYLEYRGSTFHLPFSDRVTYIPENVVIIATMNPYDKSVAELDDALLRRFSRIRVESTISDLVAVLDENNVTTDLKKAAIDFWKLANELMPHGFGHAYFYSVTDSQSFSQLWEYKLSLLFESVFQFEKDSLQAISDQAQKIIDSVADETE